MFLVETHLEVTDQVEAGGYSLAFRHDNIKDSRGFLVAFKDITKNIAIQIASSNEVRQMLWVKIDNAKNKKLRMGTIYGPQEPRTPNTELKKLHKNLETNVREWNKAKGKLLLISDFNCKVGEQIQRNISTITKGGHLIMTLMEQNKL